MESKKINQLATNVNPQQSDLTTIGDPITGQLKKITWLQVAHLIGAQASVTLQQVTSNGNTTTDPITTGGLTLTNLNTGVPRLTSGQFVGTYGYGLANGVATLDSGGKIPAAQLPSTVMEYKGTWNASTNTPTLADGTGDNGDVYLVNVAGSQNLGSGTISFAVGDWVVYNGTIWQKSLNSNAVASVFGRTGTITAQEGDYTIDQLGDVAITSAATNDYLRYNGSSWVNTQFPTFVSSDKLVLQVRNNSGATINKGTVVYINGATAGYPTIAKAQANQDTTSAQTLGLVQDNISNNSNGIVVLVGQITGIDTSAYPAGTQLYLSGTTAGAYTSTKVLAPTHLVYVGIVSTQNAVNGVIEVKIQNGYELDEIHDVAISSVANNEGLFYESSTSLWKNKSISTVLGYTPEQPLTFSAPLSRSTNTVSIPAATGSVNGYLTSTDWTTFNNKMSNPMTTLGDIIYGGASGAATRLAGNTTATKKYLIQTGDGTNSAAPSWGTISGTDVSGEALTKSDDTNVTLTLGGTPATALLRAASLTLGWTGQLAISRGGTGASTKGAAFDALSPMSALGDLIYGGASGTGTRLSGSTSASKRFLTQTGDGTNSAAPAWGTVTASDIAGSALTKTDDTNVTLTLGGSAATALLNAASLTLGWTGQLSIARGGTGLSALGTAGQLLRVNTGATALEYFTPSYISAAITSLNGLTVATQTFATGTAGTDFAISSASGVHTFDLPVASSTKTGKLSSTDWTTFNNKQSALTNPVTGTGSANRIAYWTSNSEIGSSSQFTFSPTDLFYINSTVSAGGIGMNFISTINAAANNDILYGVRISPTFNNGAFTGVTQRALGVFGNVYINGTITSGAWNGSVIGSSYGGAGTVSGIMKANGSGTVSAAVAGTDYVIPSALSSYLPLSGGTLTGALSGTSATFSGMVTSTLGNNTQLFQAASATTGYQYWNMNNTSGQVQFGVESSTGGSLITGAVAYSSYIGTNAGRTAPFYLVTNGVIRQTIDGSTGAATFSSSVTATQFIANANTSGGFEGLKLLNAGTGAAQIRLSNSAQSWIVNTRTDNHFSVYNDTSATTPFFINTSGNVGIGTTSPLSKLHVNTGTNQNFRVRPGTDVGATNGVALNSRTDDDGSLQQLTLRASDVIMLPSGNVGIGTTSPSYKLDVLGNTRIYGASGNDISLILASNGASAPYMILNGSLNSYNLLRFQYNGSDYGGIGAFNGDITAGMSFYTGTSITERMRITSGGNVGIGTTSPDNKLTVWGTNNALNSSQGNINIYTSESAAIDTGGSIGLGGYYFGTTGYIPFGNITGKKENSTDNNAAGYLAFLTRNGTTGTGERMRITSAGEVWIGYTTDQGAYALQVNGSVYASAYYESSDIRLKDVLTNSYSENFRAIEFMWKDKRDEKKHWGYAAQDVMKYIPDAIEVNNDGMMTVNYNEAHTWKIAQLEAKILELEAKLK